MISYVVETALKLNPNSIIIVANPENIKVLKNYFTSPNVKFVIQPEPKGTADAVNHSLPLVDTEVIMVLCGDIPGITPTTLRHLLKFHNTKNATATILTCLLDNPYGYGRIVRDAKGKVVKIVEEKDATDEEREVKEINSGIYIFEKNSLLEALKNVKPSKITQEYYLTQVIHYLTEKGKSVEAMRIQDSWELRGVNTKKELQEVEDILRKKTGGFQSEDL